MKDINTYCKPDKSCLEWEEKVKENKRSNGVIERVVKRGMV